MNTAALIFDLDGTVLNNEKYWGEAFRQVLEELGAQDVTKIPHTPGIGVKENWPYLLKKHEIKTDLRLVELEKNTREEYDKLSDRVEIRSGFEDFIISARKMGYLTALATSNIWLTVEKVFDRFDIQKYFDVITTGEEVEEKKPNPSIFLITAQKLGVDPHECIVFEDAQSGVEAAVSADMLVVGVVDSEDEKKHLEKAEMIIEDFTEISVDEIRQKSD